MTSYLVDTNVISEFVKPVPNPQVIRWLRDTESGSLYASVITLGEIRLGIENLPIGKRRTELEIWLQGELSAWFADNLLPITKGIADRWGRITLSARRQGLSLTTSDGLIAATALEQGLALATRNSRHFTGLGLTLFNPWEG